MNRLFSSMLIAFSAIVIMGCDKDETIVDPPVTTNPTFSSGNVKEGAVYFSFDDKKAVHVPDFVFTTQGMSPVFYLNSADLGNTQVEIYSTGETDFEAVTSFDATQLTTDPDTAVSGKAWYNYDFQTHTLSSKGLVYIVRTATDNIVKFRIENYESSAFALKYAVLDSKTKQFGAAQTAAVSPTAAGTLFSFAHGEIAAVGNWDVKLTVAPTEVPQMGVVSFPGVYLNSDRNVAAKVISNKSFEEVDADAETGLTADAEGAYVIGTDWFDYSTETHRVTSKNHTYVVQTAGGNRAKFRIKNYYNNDNVSGFMTLEYVN